MSNSHNSYNYDNKTWGSDREFQMDVVQRLTRIETQTQELAYLNIRMNAVEKRQNFLDGALKVLSLIWLGLSGWFIEHLLRGGR